MQETLLVTKLHPPPARPGLVHRQRLFGHMNQGLHRGSALTLISAPAGYGKTVLAAEWLRSLGCPGQVDTDCHTGCHVCWISLETRDSEPDRFLAYLNTAFRQGNVDIDLEIRSIQDWRDFSSIEQLLTTMVNNLSGQDQTRLILVLDDYHRISEPLIHRTIQFLLDHRPHGLHLVLLTREDPPLTLSRLRARAELTELRAADLRFTREEAEDFLRQTMHLSLQPESIRSLTERTEGWIAGLQLAALSLRQNRHEETMIGRLLGSHRYLIDYLMDEVIDAQPEEIRQFLSKTALLRRFTPGLCDALTDRNDSEAMLRTLDQANLFLIPLDEQHVWYRYHHLFADCLRKMLPARDQLLLYRKAVKWCLSHLLPEEAADYALASGDQDLAADTITSVLNMPQVWSSGHLTMLEGWLRALPESCYDSRPGLQAVAARAYSLAGKFGQAERLLSRAEETLLNQSGNLQQEQYLNLAQTGIYRAAIMAVSGHLDPARSKVTQAMAILPPGNRHIEARALDTLAMIEEQAGNLTQAESCFLEAAACAMSAGVAYLAVNALCETAVLRLVQGRLNDAEQVCRDALHYGRTQDHGHIPPAGLAWAIWGDILRERNMLDQAEQYIQKGISLASEGGLTDDLQHALLYLARLQLSRGDRETARQTLRRSILMIRAYRIPRLTALSQVFEARMELSLGHLDAAVAWANRVQAEVLTGPSYRLEREQLTIARIWLAEKRLLEARELIEAICTTARDSMRHGSLIEALVLLAIVYWQLGHEQESCQTLSEAIELAAPHGYIRVFADEGDRIHLILASCLKGGHVSSCRNYAEQVLMACTPLPDNRHEHVLSPQETRILALLAEGASNKTIAGALFISIGTAKWHVHNIYEKLGVSSRTQAISRGRDLGLIR